MLNSAIVIVLSWVEYTMLNGYLILRNRTAFGYCTSSITGAHKFIWSMQDQ